MTIGKNEYTNPYEKYEIDQQVSNLAATVTCMSHFKKRDSGKYAHCRLDLVSLGLSIKKRRWMFRITVLHCFDIEATLCDL